MADTFTNDQFMWLRQVAHDADLVPMASRVAIALTEYFNRKHDGWAWMSQVTLAQNLGVTDRAVRSALADLVDHGHLVTKRRGKMETNLYHLALKSESIDRNESSDHDRDEFSDHPPVTGRNTSSDRKKTVKVTGTDLPPNPLNEPLEEPIEVESDSLQLDLGEAEGRRGRNPRSESKNKTDAESEIGAAFESFWGQVIHKESRKEAAKLYRRIVQKGEATADQLMAAMLRFNAAMAGREPRYIKRPLKWLREGCWSDEPTKPIGTTVSGNGNQIKPSPNRQRSWADVAMAGLNRGQS